MIKVRNGKYDHQVSRISKKELNEKADIKANLKTSESQLKESQIKNQELRKRITELEKAESSDQ